MRLLLDTHIFLWLTSDDPRLTLTAREVIDSADSVVISAASMWEIAIKVRLGKLTGDLDELIAEIRRNGFAELPVFARHAKAVSILPMLHGDPFDRLLVGQAISEQLQLLTADPLLKPYSELVIQV